MQRSFNDFAAYKRDLKPKASGIEYRNFCTAMQTAKRSYDSNISNALEHNRRVLAYKAKEQGLRAACLKKNAVHEDVQNQALKDVALKQEMEKSALGETKTKLVHEHPNYSRSSHHYVSLKPLIYSVLDGRYELRPRYVD
jgi:hypothetical protein